MVEAYNYYIGGYMPKVDPRTNVHNRRELKNKYKNIISLNNANPLAMIRLSPDTQMYALDVKEMSMEMGEAAQNTLDGKPEETRKNAEELVAAGFSISEESYLSISSEEAFKVPTDFMQALVDKCETMSMNPMEYVEKKVYSYAHLHQSDLGNAYASSVYTGMLFNSYC